MDVILKLWPSGGILMAEGDAQCEAVKCVFERQNIASETDDFWLHAIHTTIQHWRMLQHPPAF